MPSRPAAASRRHRRLSCLTVCPVELLSSPTPAIAYTAVTPSTRLTYFQLSSVLQRRSKHHTRHGQRGTHSAHLRTLRQAARTPASVCPTHGHPATSPARGGRGGVSPPMRRTLCTGCVCTSWRGEKQSVALLLSMDMAGGEVCHSESAIVRAEAGCSYYGGLPRAHDGAAKGIRAVWVYVVGDECVRSEARRAGARRHRA